MDIGTSGSSGGVFTQSGPEDHEITVKVSRIDL